MNAGVTDSSFLSYLSAPTRSQLNVNILRVQMQDHMVHKTHIFTVTFFEDGVQLEARPWQQRVPTAIRDRSNLAADTDDFGAGHGTNGIKQTPGRGSNEGEAALTQVQTD